MICIALRAQTPSVHTVAENYGKLPLRFEPNRGQTDSRVKFVSRGANHSVFLTPTAATFSLGDHAIVRMELEDANPGAKIDAEDKLPGIANYLGSKNTKSFTNLPTYAKARAKSVYPGIDLVYYGTEGQLEYDFVLSPHADPSNIHLRFEGVMPSVDALGDLVLLRDMRLRKPMLYQQVDGIREPVNGRFVVAANTHQVTFQTASYDHARELVIDPVIVFSSFLGGSTQQSVINGLAVNAVGDIYVTGVTNALDYPTTPGVVQPVCPAPVAGGAKCGPSSASAAFVSKISADGQSLIYSTYLGGQGVDLGTGIAVDANDNAWVVGTTESPNFPITPDAYSIYCSPGQINSGTTIVQVEGNTCQGGDISLFLVHLNSLGTSILYGTFLGGTNGELPSQIALDPAGDIYIAGSTFTNVPGTYAQTSYYNYPTTATAYQTQALAGGIYSAFATEMTPDGKSLLYSTIFGGPGQNVFANALAVGAGKIFIGGSTVDTRLPTTAGALSTTCIGGATAEGPDTICAGGEPSGWVAEFDPTKAGAASLVFSTYLNGKTPSDASSVTALAADSTGNVFVAGNDNYPDFPATAGVLQPTCIANGTTCDTGFVTKLNPTGGLIWSTFYGSPSNAGGTQNVAAIALDSSDDVYITANATGLGDYLLSNTIQNYFGGVAYITELSSNASKVLFGTFYGGNNNVYPTGIVVDAARNIYIAGYTTGDLPLVNALQSTDGGGYNEGFFAKIAGAPSSTEGQGVFVSSASGQITALASGSIVTVYGVDLATGTENGTLPLLTNLLGTTVTIVDSTGVSTAAPLFFVSPGQVNFLVPSTVATGVASITITSGDGTVSVGAITVAAVAPGLFLVNSAALLAAETLTVDADGTQTYGDVFQVANGAIVPFPVNLGPPAQQVFLVIYGTGISNRSSLANVTVSIGGLTLPVAYAGPSSEAGLDQVNVQLPASLAGTGNTSITVTVDGVVSNTAFVTIM